MSHHTSTQERLTDRLDEFEARLPKPADDAVAFARASARRVESTTTAVWERTSEVTGRTVGTATSGVRTVTGQARAGAQRIGSTIDRALSETTGQARAQARRLTETSRDDVADALSDATETVDPGDGYDDMRKDELYQLAQDRDVVGRSSMSKGELVRALRTSS